jgi:hypothetical protein
MKFENTQLELFFNVIIINLVSFRWHTTISQYLPMDYMLLLNKENSKEHYWEKRVLCDLHSIFYAI